MPTVSTSARAVFQAVLDGKWDFLDGVVTSITKRGEPPAGRQLAGLQAAPLMDALYLPLKQTEHAWKCTSPTSRTGETGYPSSAGPGSPTGPPEIHRSLQPRRELMQQLYELRKSERPPVTGSRPWKWSRPHAPAARAVQRASRAASRRDQTHGPRDQEEQAADDRRQPTQNSTGSRPSRS